MKCFLHFFCILNHLEKEIEPLKAICTKPRSVKRWLGRRSPNFLIHIYIGWSFYRSLEHRRRDVDQIYIFVQHVLTKWTIRELMPWMSFAWQTTLSETSTWCFLYEVLSTFGGQPKLVRFYTFTKLGSRFCFSKNTQTTSEYFHC